MSAQQITELSVKRAGAAYGISMATPERYCQAECERDLGSIMSAVSLLLHSIIGDGCQVEMRKNEIMLDTFEIETLPEVAYPLRYKLVMAAGPFRYEATSDEVDEHVMLMFEAAMKFFAFKYRMITLGEEVCLNREFAAQTGALTREDG